jgi:hypothetical protein
MNAAVFHGDEVDGDSVVWMRTPPVTGFARDR